LKEGLKKYELQVIFLHGTNRNLPFEEALRVYEEGLKEILGWKPMKVNSHTGNDFWTQEQNLAFVALGDRYEKQVGIPVLHETHRGRFSYTLPDALAMLRKFPNLKYTLDISHWMVVHERILTENDPGLQEIFPSVDHIHARVGFAEGPQVPNPAAPEWENEVKVHHRKYDVRDEDREINPPGERILLWEFGGPYPVVISQVRSEKNGRSDERPDHHVSVRVFSPRLDEDDSGDKEDRAERVQRRIDGRKDLVINGG
jgi:sugar phosphate isomerase/epimerase